MSVLRPFKRRYYETEDDYQLDVIGRDCEAILGVRHVLYPSSLDRASLSYFEPLGLQGVMVSRAIEHGFLIKLKDII